MPPEESLPDHLTAAARAAQAQRERFERSHAMPDLEAAIAAWSALMAHPDFSGAPADFRASVLNEAGMTSDLRFRAGGRHADRARALQLWEQAVAVTPTGSPNRFRRLNNLAAGLMREHDYGHRVEDLERAREHLTAALSIAPSEWVGRGITLYHLGRLELSLHAARPDAHPIEAGAGRLREALALAAPGTHERVAVLDVLTGALRDLYHTTHRVEHLREALAASREALRTSREGPGERSSRLLMLAADLHEVFRRGGRLEDLDAAISSLRHGLELDPRVSSRDASHLGNLGLLLKARYDASGRAEDLEDAIDLLRRSAASPATDARAQAGRFSNLASALVTRYQRLGQGPDVDEALDLYRESLALVPHASAERALHLDALGYGLIASYIRTGRLDVLDEAIDMCRQALSLLPGSHSERNRILNNLANDLKDRYLRTGRLEDLDEALGHWQEALSLQADDPAEQASFLSNLGAGLRARYARTLAVEDLNAAIAVLNQALALTPRDGTERPWRLNNLASALGDRHTATASVEDLQASVAAYRDALARLAPSTVGRPGVISNTGLALRDLYRHTRQPELLDEAIDLFRQALDTAPPDAWERAAAWLNLGSSLRTRYDRTNAAEDLAAAIAAYEEAVARGADRVPEVVLIAARRWCQWALERASFAEAARAAEYGLAEVDRLLSAQYQRRHQEDWLFAARGVGADGAYALARAGDLQRAVEVLEASRAYFLSEVLERNRRDLDRLAQLGHRALLDDYRRTSAEWEALAHAAGGEGLQDRARRMSATREQLDACRARLNAILDEIRRVPGYEDLLRAPAFSRIQVAATPAPLVYVVATRAGGMALIVWDPSQQRAGPVDAVPLPGLTESALIEQMFGANREAGPAGYLGTYARQESDARLFDSWTHALDDVTGWLWQTVMQPIVETLTGPQPAVDHGHRPAPATGRPAPAAVLIPSGLLALLPLHAAWRADAALPSGRRYALDDVSLSYAPNARALAAARWRAAGLAADTLLIVADPQPVTGDPLPNAGREAQTILQLWPESGRTIREQHTATHAEVTNLLPRYGILHYAGHAFAGWDAPRDGGLLLANDRVLTVRELQDMDLKLRLAVLSACETGVPGARIPDEVIGLPAALIEAGVAGVVASLWSVPDDTTAGLMEDFYVRWRTPELIAQPAEALRRAQRALRDAGHGHPFYWAAFTCSGA